MLNWLASSFQDLRHGVVLLRRDAGVSALIVLVLALGIGGNAAIFTLLKAAFFDPLPYRDGGRLVTIMESSGWNPSVSEFLEIRRQTRTLEQLAFAEHLDMQITGTAEPARVFAARVTASFFPLLGVNPALGRAFQDEDNQPGRAPAVILSDAFWHSRMGADRGVLGRTLRLDGQPAQVVGVLPPAFHFDYPTLRIPEPVDIYVSFPLETSALLASSASGKGAPVRVIGRLRPGIDLPQAEADLRSIATAIVRDHPTAYRTREGKSGSLALVSLPLREAVVGTQRSLLWLLVSGVGVLLLIACANAAQLLLARSLQRGREVAIRSALGASRLRLIRQFLLEGLVLGATGGAAGLLAAGSIAGLLIRLLPVRSPLLASAHVDARVVAFTLVITLASAILCGIIPAVRAVVGVPARALRLRPLRGREIAGATPCLLSKPRSRYSCCVALAWSRKISGR